MTVEIGLSQHELQKLGKRFRDGIASQADVETLEAYRDSHDKALLEAVFSVSELLLREHIPFLATGRLKRTKSIIRKLKRPENAGMDLSRLGDLGGLRIIVRDVNDEAKCDAALRARWPEAKVLDYRDRSRGYRAVHYVLNFEKKRIEVQLRTLVQHLWAGESESFGERVKEGDGPMETREYLDCLADCCYRAETHNVPLDECKIPEDFRSRSPWTKIIVLQNRFDRAVTKTKSAVESVVVIFDTATGEIANEFVFSEKERSEALMEYRRKSRDLSEERYDILIFNSASQEAIKVTHARYFM